MDASKSQKVLQQGAFGEMHELSKRSKGDVQLFKKRLNFIKKQLDCEVEPMKVVSRDRTRTNRNGVSLDVLEARGERYVP